VPKLYVCPSQNAHVEVTSTGTADTKTITLEPNVSAIVVCAKTNVGFLSFNGSTPSASNGTPIIPGAQPVTLSVGFYSHGAHQLKWASSAAANSVLDVLQLV
jgi:hypothetical protein